MAANERDNESIHKVIEYYRRTESRLGYRFLLGGTKHFGYYSPGDPKVPFHAALRRMEDKLARSLSLVSESSVLDAGCGVGDVAMYLASLHGLRVTGIDILDSNLLEARKRAAAKGVSRLAEFRHMSYSNLDFSSSRFDGVYTMETLVHAENPEQVLTEFQRVLKPGGRLALFEYSHADESVTPSSVCRVLREISDAAAMPGFQRFEHGVLVRLVRQVGFTNVQTEDITVNIMPMLRIFAALGAIPYAIGVLTGLNAKIPNARAAVELWRCRRYLRYNVITAMKAS